MLRFLSSPRHVLAGAIAALLLVPAAASAQTPGAGGSGASTTAIREAEQRFEEGKTLFSQRRYADARLKFEQACAVHRTVNCPKNLGLAEFELGQYVEATTHLREFLQGVRVSGPAAAGLDAEGVAVIQKKYTDAFMHCGHLEVSAPAGATVVVEGRNLGTAPLRDTVDVPAGDHTVEAHTDRGILRQKVTVAQGEVAPVKLSEPNAGAQVKVDADSLRADRPGHSSARTVVLVSLYGAALLATGAGIGLTLHAEARKGDADDRRGDLPSNGCTGVSSAQCDDLRSLRDTYDADKRWATAAFIGAGVFAATATVMFFVWPNTVNNERPAGSKSTGGRTADGGGMKGRVVPMLAPGLGGLGYAGTF
ncbi:PEGA domain-containing protein [Pendulispora rubella]|uniref:PEGA domain-containing protein n=1 Tax=Pendulispora rubella TaxID=2741070 RepID=A0ABZ2LGZ7_9BACT